MIWVLQINNKQDIRTFKQTTQKQKIELILIIILIYAIFHLSIDWINLLLWSIEFLRNSLSTKSNWGEKFWARVFWLPPLFLSFSVAFSISASLIIETYRLKTKLKRHLIQFHTNANANRSHFMLWFQSLDDVFWDRNLLLGAIQRNGVKIFYAEGSSIFRFFSFFEMKRLNRISVTSESHRGIERLRLRRRQEIIPLKLHFGGFHCRERHDRTGDRGPRRFFFL